MKGGIDRGFCLSFWRLSYRRKFIRTIWGGLAGMAVLVFFQINGEVRQLLDDSGVPNSELVGWLFIGVVFLGGILQAAYYWRRWHREVAQPA